MKKVLTIATVTSILSIVFMLNWFDLNIFQVILVIVLELVTIGIGLLIYVLTGFAKKDYNKIVLASEVKEEQELIDEIKQLEKDLLTADQPVASKQSARLLNLLNDFNRVIKKKLGDSQITYSSYTTESTKVFKLVKQNLEDILVMDISIETVEAEHGSNIPEHVKELVDKQWKSISDLIESNKDLLKALNVISVEVANIKDIDSFEYTQLQNRLKELANRAKDYSKK